MINKIIEKLAEVEQGPCVSISLNTHRTHPENARDSILLKNLLQEARIKLAEVYEKGLYNELLKKMGLLEKEIDHQKNLNSLHIFLSNDIFEVQRSIWSIEKSFVFVGEEFALNALIQMQTEQIQYYILSLSQGGTKLYSAENQAILEEVRNDDFPFDESTFYTTHGDTGSDSKLVDKLLLEYLNGIDKAIQRLFKTTKLKTVVLSTKDMYTKLIQVSDNQGAYYDHAAIDYNHLQKDDMVNKAWEIVQEEKNRSVDILMQEIARAVPQGKVFTEINDIARAAKEGRAEFLVLERGFRFNDQFNNYALQQNINNRIAYDVLKNQGMVCFADADQMQDFGRIVLKTRY